MTPVTLSLQKTNVCDKRQNFLPSHCKMVGAHHWADLVHCIMIGLSG